MKKIGIVGGKRGKEAISYFTDATDAKIVAICDFNLEVLQEVESLIKELKLDIKLISDFDDFLNEGLDGVILANFANEHAPFAIKCMQMGIAVLIDVLPVATLKEAVELVETVEKTGAIYHYGENYCFLDGVLEMKRQYDLGHIGEVEYAEGEYFHNCETIWHFFTGGNPDHWRNTVKFDNFSLIAAGYDLPAGNRYQLDKFVAIAQQFTKEGYTEESFNALQSVLITAKELPVGAPQKDIDIVREALEQAILALVKNDITAELIEFIDGIDQNVTAENIDQIKSDVILAKTLYGKLSQEEQVLVENYAKLTELEDAISQFETSSEAVSTSCEAGISANSMAMMTLAVAIAIALICKKRKTN